ncbi:MAG: dihydrodipicolinate synthase [Osedax symbiont Rs2]|nr:MAG: dihydrodipicolinate synthase [Osedax symbiont Rs2]
MFYGSYVALITPFQQGHVDEPALRKLVDFHIDSGTQGIVPVGTTGEASTLSNTEHKKVVNIVVEQTGGRIPVIAGAGSNNPAEALEYAQHAQRAGADGVLCVAGYYNRPSQEGLYQHFKYIHDNIEIPMIVYNIPARAIVDVLPETMQRLARLERVVGVKDATAELARVSVEQQLIEGGFSYFSGEDMTAVGYNAMGGTGCISVTANVAPRHCAQLQQACREGDFKQAQKLQQQLLALHQALFLEPSPAGVKYAASVLGLCDENVRLPIVEVSQQTKESIRRAIDCLNLI